MLLIHDQGAMCFYTADFRGENKAISIKNEYGFITLGEADFNWEPETEYRLTLQAQSNKIILTINDIEVLQAEDDAFSYGMYGCGTREMGRTLFGAFKVRT